MVLHHIQKWHNWHILTAIVNIIKGVRVLRYQFLQTLDVAKLISTLEWITLDVGGGVGLDGCAKSYLYHLTIQTRNYVAYSLPKSSYHIPIPVYFI